MSQVEVNVRDHVHGRSSVVRTGVSFPVTDQTAAFTAVAGDVGEMFNCDGTFTITLTAAATLAAGWSIGITNDGSGTITIDGDGAETINNAATITVDADKSVILYCTGTEFFTIGGGDDRLEVYIDAKQMVPTGGINPPLTRQETATNAINYETRDFDQTTRESAYFQVRSPDNWDLGNITFDIIWTALAGTGDVRWQIFANSLSNDDAIDQAFGADTALTDTLLATEDIHIASLNFTPGLTPAAGDIVFARIDRRAATAEDTLNADANLIGVRIKFVTTA